MLTDPESSHLTSFGCEFGLFKYVKRAQGLANAPATFQRWVDSVFKDKIKKKKVRFLGQEIEIASFDQLKNDVNNCFDTWNQFSSNGCKALLDSVTATVNISKITCIKNIYSMIWLRITQGL